MFGVIDSEVFRLVILPVLIFLARICDQSMGTLRLIFISKGFKFLAPLLAFFESLIWLVAVSQIFNHLDNVATYLAYAGGYAMGNYVGMMIEERLSLGNVIVRIFTNTQILEFKELFHKKNYGYTIMNAEGSTGDLKVIFSIINRKDLNEFVQVIKTINPNIFYTIEEVKSVEKGIFKTRNKNALRAFLPSGK